ncbi:IS110 family transposase [bacterium]|nr:IS110 family transposase [bacterium]
MKKIMHLGIDVDDNAFHGCGLFESGGKEQMLEFKTKPSIGSLMQKLGNLQKEGFSLKVCYEATYLGFSLCRDLQDKKVHCDVIAPSSIPTRSGKTAKTDKIDTRDLARYYKNGLLSIVEVPAPETEKIRDLIRSRDFIAQQSRDLKRHILSTCRRMGIHYHASIPWKNARHFTHGHKQWIETEMNKQKDAHFQFNMMMLLSQLRQFETQLEHYKAEIEKISETASYKKKVKALTCYRGIDVLSAMTFIVELGDIKRFSHPRKLTSYAGMDLREYSSGGKERRYSMSKMGNVHIRTTAVETCQRPNLTPQVSRSLKLRREGTSPKFIEIADRCMKRLYQKSTRMLYAGKPANKIKVACARELLGFVWESLLLAEA